MGADKSATIVPGHGTLFVADKNTAMPAGGMSDFSLTGSAPAGWVNIGHTSKDNLPAFTKDGGDKTVLDTWLADGVEVVYASTQWSLGFNPLQVDELGLDLAFGGSFDDDGGYIVPSSQAGEEKALFLYSTDGTGELGFYIPDTSVAIGDAPSFDPAKFFELPLVASILAADDDVIPVAANGLPGIMKIYKTGLTPLPPVIDSVSPTTGAAGTEVEIFGSGFTGMTGAGAVKFGATNAGVGKWTFIDDEHATAIVVGSAGSAPITVTTPNGTSATKAFTIS